MVGSSLAQELVIETSNKVQRVKKKLFSLPEKISRKRQKEKGSRAIFLKQERKYQQKLLTHWAIYARKYDVN